MTDVRPRTAYQATRIAEITTWTVLAVDAIALTTVNLRYPDVLQTAVTIALSVFFLAVLSWLTTAIVAQRARRKSLTILLLAVLLWASGSAILNATAKPDLTKFPSPGEWLFLGSYVGLAAYLLTDHSHRISRTLTTWLEATVICGATGCLAGTLLLSPVATEYSRNGVALLLALLYPLIDIALGLLVVAQVALRGREDLRQSIALVIAFALFTYADVHFVGDLDSGVYDSSVINDTCYGIAFALIASSACRVRSSTPSTLPRRQHPAVLLSAGVIALLVLALRPTGSVGKYLVIVALITLTAVGGRLVVALRDANRAAEAFALSRSDDLTQLPNRRAVLALMEERLDSHQPLSLMILDLDGFKDVNDTLGHPAGDTVLQLIAHRMRAALAPEIMIARLGGDEFATVMPTSDPIDAMEAAQAVLRAVHQPLTVDGVALVIDASIGITVRSSRDTISTQLLRRADVAMYQAKVTRSGALLYDAHYDDFSREKLQIAEELRKGIQYGQLRLWYQPQIDAGTRRVSGLEALVRWQHPRDGLLSPVTFLPAARRAGLMSALSAEVVRIAIEDLKRWRASGLDPQVAINCAPPELMSGAFLPTLYAAMREANVPARSIVIEVTEDSFINEPERAREVLQDIRRHGLQISIDDYGTGFSSLSYLRDLPVQELKIDRSFITGIRNDPRSRMIVASTLQMAQALELRTVAEGVEDSATAAELVAMGVDVMQGYYLARPMQADQVEAWLGDWVSFADIGIAPSPDESGSL